MTDNNSSLIQAINHKNTNDKFHLSIYTASASAFLNAYIHRAFRLYHSSLFATQSITFIHTIHPSSTFLPSFTQKKSSKLPWSNQMNLSPPRNVFHSSERGCAGAHMPGCLCGCPCASVPSETDGVVVCGGALKFSLSDRGLWDTSVSHCLLCSVFTPVRQGYSRVGSGGVSVGIE